MLYVSHDRYFINRTATRILELTGQTFISYIGNYDYYLEKKDLMQSLYASREPETRKNSSGSFSSGGFSAAPSGAPLTAEDGGGTASASTDSKQDWTAQKEEKARIRNRPNELKRTEEEIHRLETRNSESYELLTREDICRDVPKLIELNTEKENLEERLLALYEQWESLAQA